MRISSIIDNVSSIDFPVEHGLSLHIEMDNKRNVLFDMGQRRLFAENAERLNLDIADVDIAIVSHGHYDHGGGLNAFLDLNRKAKVYIHQDAFQAHYSLKEDGLKYIGIDKDLQGSNRLVMCSSVTRIDDGMTLFADVQGTYCSPRGNRLLFGPSKTENDVFTHEQSLIIEENGNVILFAGCAHKGIINIMRKAQEVVGKPLTHVFAGMHLVNKSKDYDASKDQFLTTLAHELMKYPDCQFYTMHCTGTEQFAQLKSIMGSQISYLSCGESTTL